MSSRPMMRLFLWLAVAYSSISSCAALEWAVERNFRYFVYPSDVAIHLVAADIFFGQHKRIATAEDLELLINGPDFWSTPLDRAGDRRQNWPNSWRNPSLHNPAELIAAFRREEGRAAVDFQMVGRLGWASTMAHARDARRTMGGTDTCWDPSVRLHTNCRQYGDYVRPPGWIVRIYDPAASAGDQCSWSGDGGFYAEAFSESHFVDKKGGLAAKSSPWKQDLQQNCREVRVYVPSDASDPKRVSGKAHVVRTNSAGIADSIDVAPADSLIIGFGDSFTSGEGNPEQPARFTQVAWPDIEVPKRNADLATRAQWTDRWCHRSVYSWQVRTALDVAIRSPHRSVTLLPYGCSGAEIFSGLLYAYNGVEYDHAEDHGILGDRAELGAAYQELCLANEYAPASVAYNQPIAQDDNALNRAVGKLNVDQWKAQFPSPKTALAFLRKNVTRCNASSNRMKRGADLVLLDIGINDVQFSSWVAGAILEGPLRTLVGGFIPQRRMAGSPCGAECERTELLLARLQYRYGILRQVLDTQLLPDLGLAAPSGAGADAISAVLAPIYPPALQNESGALCGLGNAGMTVSIFPPSLFPSPDARACENGIWLNVSGPITAIRHPDDLRAIEWFRENALNANLRNFALAAPVGSRFSVIENQIAEFASRGFCATKDRNSRPSAECFAYQDLQNTPCAADTAESLNIPREGSVACGSGPAAFSPFQASEFYPYRTRTRLFRTQNDVYLLIDNRPKSYTDDTKAGVLDLNGRTTSGAFHPTAEAHAIVAKAASAAACVVLRCEQ